MGLDMMLYFGVLAFVAFGGLALFVVLALREDKKSSPAKATRVRVPVDGPQMLVVLPKAGKPLQWIINGQRYTHPDQVTEAEDLALLTEFLGRLRLALPNQMEGEGLSVTPVSMASVNGTSESGSGSESESASDAFAEPNSSSLSASSFAAKLAAKTNPDASSPARTYEEEMERPFVERLRTSFFNPPPSTTQRVVLEGMTPSTSFSPWEGLEPILQARLALMPDVPEVELRPGRGGLLQIIVGGRSYERVDDIPNEQVRQAMREAIKVWEAR